ncbi:MAG: hypothetical protein LBN05_08985 [Oscillospiraceae bacterium]|jgi:hypothetical protein|nr:hypothetical protein [Oscillospiraceae bacterium]
MPETLTYQTTAEADAYVAAHYRTNSKARTTWDALSEEDKGILLANACESIEGLPFTGRKAQWQQPFAFPRLPQQYGRPQVVPDKVKAAQVELALWAMQDADGESAKRQELQAQGVQSFSIGDLSESYGTTGAAASQPAALLCLKSAALLRGFLSGGYAVC